ncbi:Uncharacterised protein [Mycobacterium tuberculosis]|nr:Uncharacterised protein [Mycobacterium tuberculosis]CFS38904.1 Uncharacterised protein [Mycobacterium tuberculosis]CNN08101.1 Uncharacterised protein [Mycobacterium tuberculosis]CNV55747.1 Uncharacterised protein [Mycobacterium tuberculosis]CNW79984.1 Uncharacterised protein [Mycobacterium tuberculosis]
MSAPFCGANTLAVPHGPSNGYSTSEAAITSTSANCRRAASRPPSSAIIPFPPSVHALPPNPTTIRAAPARSAAAMSWPTPLLWAASAVSGVGGPPSNPRPQACAHSKYAVAEPGSNTHAAFTTVFSGPQTRSRRVSPSRLPSTSTKPGPPSDWGATMNESPGRDRVQPVAMAAAASTADRLSP